MFARLLTPGKRPFDRLSEQEILALAISSEEDDMRIYRAYADGLRENFPASAAVFDGMAEEENEHRARLIELHRKRFGDIIPLIRREHVKNYYERKPDWLVRPLSIDKVRNMAAEMERQAERFYRAAAARTSDATTRKLLGDLALAESRHEAHAIELGKEHTPDNVKAEEAATEHRQFLLTYVQPGLAGLMDGSISTLAPIFAAAFATGDTWNTFLIGLSARLADQTGAGFRHYDNARRLGTRVTLLDIRFHHSHHGCHYRGRHRTVTDNVDTEPLHGNTMAAGDAPGGAGRVVSVRRRRV